MNIKPLHDKVLVKRVDEENKRVLFGKWAVTEIKLNGETRLIIKESDILAIIE